MTGAAFLLYIIAMCMAILCGISRNNELSLQSVRKYVNGDLPGRENYINLYGAVQLALSKKNMDRFSILKTSYGKLFEPRQSIEDGLIESWVDNIEQVSNYLEDRGVTCVYLSSVIPLQELTDSPYEIDYFAHENSQKVQRGLKDEGVNVLNLPDSERISSIPKEEVFYKTDHHWSMRTVFAAYQEVIDSARLSGLNIVPFEMNDFTIWSAEKSFLGSYGIRAGSIYAGMDDFVIYVPDFETDFIFRSFASDHQLILEKTGNFFECLHDQDILMDDTYRNKYNAYSNGGCIENVIINKNVDNDYKMLYISHSYGRPLSEYFALNFHEVRNLDPSPGRYNGNIQEYIEDYNPDYVVIQMENEGFVVGELNVG